MRRFRLSRLIIVAAGLNACDAVTEESLNAPNAEASLAVGASDEIRGVTIDYPEHLPAYFQNGDSLVSAIRRYDGEAFIAFKKPENSRSSEKVAQVRGLQRTIALDPISTADIDAGIKVVQEFGGEVVTVLPRSRSVLARIDPEIATELRHHPRIDFIEPPQPVYSGDARIRNGLPSAAHASSSQELPDHALQVRADKAWLVARGSGINLYVLDTGVGAGSDGEHPDLNQHACIDLTSFGDCGDRFPDNGHGTGVAGVATAVDNEEGIIGIAPDAWLHSYNVVGATAGATIASIAIALDSASNEPNGTVVNMSLQMYEYSGVLAAATASAAADGVLMIAIAGNTNQGPQHNPAFVAWPGRFSNVVAVSGVTASNAIAPPGLIMPDGTECAGSRWGPEVMLAAPFVTHTLGRAGDVVWQCGTSFAAPAVAAAAALIWSRNPVWSATQVWPRLQDAKDLGSPGFDPVFGFGLADACLIAACDTRFTFSGPGIVEAGQSATWRVTGVWGGVAPYSYKWYLDGVLAATSGTTFTRTFTPGQAGSHSVKVTVTPSVGLASSETRGFVVDACGSRGC